MSDSHDIERVVLDGSTRPNDLVIAGMNRLLIRVLDRGNKLTAGDIRLRQYYDAHYLRDEVVITWDKVSE